MPKSITLGNGAMLVGLDAFAQVKDFYYHYAGLENHVSEGLLHKMGVWCEGVFHWIDDGSWNITVDSEKGTMASKITAINEQIGVELQFSDVVYNEKDIFIREITIKNNVDRDRTIKLFINQQFNPGHTYSGDTAYFDPYNHVLIHYKGRRVFLINAIKDTDDVSPKGAFKHSFTEYCTGILGLEGKQGTYVDAEDGTLVGNPIEHGQVDSVMGITFEIKKESETQLHYWITAAKSIAEAQSLNEYVLSKGVGAMVASTKNYWKAWVHNQNFSFYGLSDPLINLFHKSLIQIRTHVSKNGAILASGDSDLLKHGRDTYSYIWPRDAAFSALALARAGDFNASKRFFEFCNNVVTPDGYFMHKYLPDGSLGSSWHPWIQNGTKQLPIQEDGTALVLFSLWRYYEYSKDLEFIEEIYNSLIRKSAEFMVEYRDKSTGLPKPSYDLWEEKYGVSTFTASGVYGALTAAKKFARLLGKEQSAARYQRAADSMKDGILKHLYNKEEGYFYKQIKLTDQGEQVDKTVDMSSPYGVYRFGVLEPEDERLQRAMKYAKEKLSVHTPIGGIARYEGDWYHRVDSEVPGNPWVITTLWNVQYQIEFLQKESELPEIVKQIAWCADKALPSGVLAEQFNPLTGEPLSAAPLTWSHAEYVTTVIKYLEKLELLGICKACYPLGGK